MCKRHLARGRLSCCQHQLRRLPLCSPVMAPTGSAGNSRMSPSSGRSAVLALAPRRLETEPATWMRMRTCRSRWPRAPRAGQDWPAATGPQALDWCSCPCSLWEQTPLPAAMTSFSPRVRVSGPTLLIPRERETVAYVLYVYFIYIYICIGPWTHINTGPL